MTTAPSPPNLERALSSLPPFLSPSDVATALKMNEDTITKWLSDGVLRGFKIGRPWHIIKADLLEDITRAYNVADPSTVALRARAGDGR